MPAQAFRIKLFTQCGYLLIAALARTLTTYASEQDSEQKWAFLRRNEKSKMWTGKEWKDGKGRPGAGGEGQSAMAQGSHSNTEPMWILWVLGCVSQIPEPLKTYSITTGIFKNYF